MAADKLGTKIDKLFKLKDKEGVMSKKLADAKKLRTELETEIMEDMIASRQENAGGKLGKISLTKSVVPVAKDWPSIYRFITREGAFDLLNRALNAKAYRDRIEAGETINGMESFTKTKFNATRKKVVD